MAGSSECCKRAYTRQPIEGLTQLVADLGDYIGHIVGVDQLRLGLTTAPGYAEDLARLAALHRQLGSLAKEELGLVEGMHELTIYPKGTQEVGQVLGGWNGSV